MTDNKKFFLDLSGLQILWNKMKSTFASKSEIDNITLNINALKSDIDGVEALTLSYAPKEAYSYSVAVELAKEVPAGTIIIVGNDELINDTNYVQGFYIVDNDKIPHYIGTSSGTATNEEIATLRNRIATLEKQIIKTASIVDADGNALSAFTIANNDLVVVYDDKVVADSDSVNALTHRAIAARFGEIESKISAIPKFKISVVDSLPTDSETKSFSTIYLVKTGVDSDNIYTEYIYVQDSTNGNHWEILGSQSLALDNYVTKEFLTSTINSALKEYAKIADVEKAIEAAKTEVLTDVANNYAIKAEVLAEDDIILSITTGKIGEEIQITPEQINALLN